MYAFARGSKTDADMKGVLLTLFSLYLAMERFPSCFKALFLTFQLPELYINGCAKLYWSDLSHRYSLTQMTLLLYTREMPANTHLVQYDVLQVFGYCLGDPEVSPRLGPRAEARILPQKLPQHRKLAHPEHPFHLCTAVRLGVLVLPANKVTLKCLYCNPA